MEWKASVADGECPVGLGVILGWYARRASTTLAGEEGLRSRRDRIGIAARR